MINLGKKNILGILINAVDYESSVDHIINAAKKQQPFAVSALAVHGVMTGVLNSEHRYRLNNIDWIVPDGQPVRWALNWLHGTNLPDRVYGPTLTLKICKRIAQEGLSVYLYGSRQETVEGFVNNLKSQFPHIKIAGYEPSLFRKTSIDEKREIVRRIRHSGAHITLVGLGCPRQEVWAYEYRDALSMPILAVGAAFDFHAGIVSQAPEQLQAVGLEWLYRFAKEPKRLWRRYIILNPVYLILLFTQLTGIKQYDPFSGVASIEECLYG